MSDPVTLATAAKWATVASGVGSTLAAVKGLTQKTPKPPSTPASTTMPTEDSQLVADAKRRALIAQSTRGGRASTVLTDNDTFGGN